MARLRETFDPLQRWSIPTRSHVTRWFAHNGPNRQGFTSLTPLSPRSLPMCKCVQASHEPIQVLTGTGKGTPSLINLLSLRLVQGTYGVYIRPHWTVIGVVKSTLDRLDQERVHFEDLKGSGMAMSNFRFQRRRKNIWRHLPTTTAGRFLQFLSSRTLARY